jgi:hypothetical protein
MGKVRKKRTGDAKRATRDERSDHGKHLLWSKGNVKGLRDRYGTLEHVENGLVAGLDGYDASGCREESLVLYEVSSTKIRANANVLDESCRFHHCLDIYQDTRKVERTARQWRGAKVGDELLFTKKKKVCSEEKSDKVI